MGAEAVRQHELPRVPVGWQGRWTDEGREGRGPSVVCLLRSPFHRKESGLKISVLNVTVYTPGCNTERMIVVGKVRVAAGVVWER